MVKADNESVGRISTHAPAGGATSAAALLVLALGISTHAPAGGATRKKLRIFRRWVFLLTPLREGRLQGACRRRETLYFYSRPCGRGDSIITNYNGG